MKLNIIIIIIIMISSSSFSVQSPGEIKRREVELGCRNRTDCLAAELVLNSRFSDTVFVTLRRTAVETAVSEVHKLFCTDGVPTSLTSLFWRWLTGLFGLYGSEHADELFTSSPHLPPPTGPPSSVPNKPYVFYGRKRAMITDLFTFSSRNDASANVHLYRAV